MKSLTLGQKKTDPTTAASRNYFTDPDGEGRLAPFTVYFDMTDKNGVGVTCSHQSWQKAGRTWQDKGATHVTLIKQERVCLSWPVSTKSPGTVSSLSSSSVMFQCFSRAAHGLGGGHVNLLRWRAGVEHLSMVSTHAGWLAHVHSSVLVVTVMWMTKYGVKTAVSWLIRQSVS